MPPSTQTGNETALTGRRGQTYDLVYVSLFAVLITICSWISIQTAVPFTLQTLGVFLSVSVLGGKRGTLSVLVYILLGAVGLPVFSGFLGGVGILFGNTGGYIFGFLFSALIMWGIERLTLRSRVWRLLSMLIGLFVCYAFGTAWFMLLYTKSSGPVSLAAVLGWCVIPFIIPDLAKIAVVYFISPKIKRYVVSAS